MPGKLLSDGHQAVYPPCLFPLSSDKSENPITQNVISDSLNGRWDGIEASFKKQGISMASILKASWGLSLQCYVSPEVVSFEYYAKRRASCYHKTGNGTNGITEQSSSSLCMFHLARDEELLNLLMRLESAQESPFPISTNTEQAVSVSPIPASKFWNTTLAFGGHVYNQEPRSIGANVHLVVSVKGTPGGRISTSIHYDSSRINEQVAQSVHSTFNRVLSDVLTFPQSRVGQVEACSYADQFLIRKITSRISQVENTCVHDLVLRQCRLHPSRIAVSGWDGDLTYGELDDLSLRLAHYLASLGIGPETFVFSCFPRSIWPIVTRLGIMRAGGAYVSILSTDPPAYIDSAVQRTRARVLLSDPENASKFRPLIETVLEVTPDWLRQLPHKSCPLNVTVRPNNACLIVFTSGSTGRPKGIVQKHQSYSTALLDYVKNLGLKAHTRFLGFDDYAFDICNLEFLVPLIIGGCCVVPCPTKMNSDLHEVITGLQANIAFLSPTAAMSLDPKKVPCLETLCIGGEPMPRDFAQKWQTSSTKLINQYGMGEAAICCAYNEDVQPEQNDVIGKAATGAIWIVDATSPERLMPVGAVGELLIEGPHLSQKYLDEVGQSQQAVFLDEAPSWMDEMHPERVHTSRFYRSGDLGRLRHDGTIQYIGRKDHILKFDGRRVDALEVEFQARRCLTQKDAIVVDMLHADDDVTEPELAAYVYLDDHPESSAALVKGEPILSDAVEDSLAAQKVEEIKQVISNKLPLHMVPTRFILTSWMPRTASKKTDRKRLRVAGDSYQNGRSKRRRAMSMDNGVSNNVMEC
ncbi:hypothetical protein JX265_012043 [Neoarthrinium moseri]|uniref:AMP-dependent synthetase/ligase domain-containing protein n=1 Tax=Neoarthrinium moseri TaxID=1658444 RepID=A0A9P9WBM4_9PEZI|nr:hypothetical protein JX265_012043 [Neoarthrinium moseri]